MTAVRAARADEGADLPPLEDEHLGTEARVFTRYLTGVDADDYVVGRYRDLHLAPALRGSINERDEALVRWARSGPFRAELADGFAALFARRSRLRTKLVLTYGILETRQPFAGRLERQRGGWFALVRLGLRAACMTALGTLLVGPGHILRSRGRG